MNKQIETALLELGFKKENFNTTNAWGFGGGIGVIFTKDNNWIKFGRACYRHAPSHNYISGGGLFEDVETLKQVKDILNSNFK